MVNIVRNLKNWQIFLILITLAVVTSIGSAIVNPDKTDITWWSGWLQNFSTEMLGAIVTFALFEIIVRNRDEKDNLIIQMRNQNNATALNAVERFRANSGLIDGTLQGADLKEANLQHARLSKANLQYTKLSYANLQNASLWQANLQDAKLLYANLQGAKLWLANLQGASLIGAKLEKADIGSTNMAGVKCNKDTILPNGEHWTPDVDWSEFYAVEFDDPYEFETYLRSLVIQRA